MTIRHCLTLADLISLLLSLQFLKQPYLHKKPDPLLHFTFISSQCAYVTLDIVFLSVFSPLGAVLQAMFYFQALVSTCCISACWLLVISQHQMSMDYYSVSNTYPTQIKLALPKLLCALSHFLMCCLIQCSLLVLFSYSLCYSEFLALLIFRQQSL